MSSESDVRPIPEESRIILDHLLDEISVDQQTRALKDRVKFTGTPKPFLPLPFKSQACTAALHGVFGTVANRISELRFGKPQDISINTDHASMFLNGVFMFSIDGYGLLTPEVYKFIPEVNEDPNSNELKTHTSSIYQCKDGRYFHLHGSLMSKKTLNVLGIDPEQPIKDKSQAREIIQEVIGNFTAEELQSLMTDAGLCGDICLKPDEYDETEQGKIMNKKPIVEIRSIGPSVPPTPFTINPSSGKILDGIKVVEFSRVVAGPVLGRCLAELGATIVRVIAPDLPDFKIMQPDFNVDKRPVHINLRTPKGQAQLKHLLQEADVFIQGYRPGRLASFGFGPEALSEIAAKRNKGMVIVDESCYGEEGPWAARPGYQQIADVVTGVAWETGRASGKNNPIVPCFPISDYGAGIAGAIAVLVGLLRRAEQGGSWFAHTSLTQFNLFQRRQGQYPHDMIRKLYEEGPPMDYDWFMGELVAGFIVYLQKVRPDLFDISFDVIPDTPFGKNFRHVAPVCKWSDHPTRFSSTAPWGHYRPGWNEDDADELESKVAGLEG